MSPAHITLILFGTMVIGIALGLPLTFVLGGVGVISGAFFWGIDSLYIHILQVFSNSTNYVLAAIPLFIFMALLLLESGIAGDLYEMMYIWMGPLRGGLAIGTVVICTIFAAMSGISGAAAVSMGLIALPSMLNRKYDTGLALGCISAGAALGVLIPPSIIMVVYGLMADVSVGKLFAGGIVPGIILTILFILYIGIRSYFQPHIAPALPKEERLPFRQKLASLKSVTLPFLLIIVVLGSIFGGIASPTEAAAFGAVGSLLCCFVSRNGLTWEALKKASFETLRTSSMVVWILIGGACFSTIFIGIGGPELVRDLMADTGLGCWGILILIQVTFFVLGMFLDQTSIIMITIPVYMPIVQACGWDPVWFGILYVVNMEMAFLTPPFGFNLFFMKGVAPKGVTMGDIYKSIAPFIILQLVGLILIMIFPQLVLWLPNLIFG